MAFDDFMRTYAGFGHFQDSVERNKGVYEGIADSQFRDDFLLGRTGQRVKTVEDSQRTRNALFDKSEFERNQTSLLNYTRANLDEIINNSLPHTINAAAISLNPNPNNSELEKYLWAYQTADYLVQRDLPPEARRKAYKNAERLTPDQVKITLHQLLPVIVKERIRVTGRITEEEELEHYSNALASLAELSDRQYVQESLQLGPQLAAQRIIQIGGIEDYVRGKAGDNDAMLGFASTLGETYLLPRRR